MVVTATRVRPRGQRPGDARVVLYPEGSPGLRCAGTSALFPQNPCGRPERRSGQMPAQGFPEGLAVQEECLPAVFFLTGATLPVTGQSPARRPCRNPGPDVRHQDAIVVVLAGLGGDGAAVRGDAQVGDHGKDRGPGGVVDRHGELAEGGGHDGRQGRSVRGEDRVEALGVGRIPEEAVFRGDAPAAFEQDRGQDLIGCGMKEGPPGAGRSSRSRPCRSRRRSSRGWTCVSCRPTRLDLGLKAGSKQLTKLDPRPRRPRPR